MYFRFMDVVRLVHKPRQLNVAAQLMEAQSTCGPMDSHSRVYFSGAQVWAYLAAVGVLNIQFMTSCFHIMSVRIQRYKNDVRLK